MEYFHRPAWLSAWLCSLPAPAHLLVSWIWEIGEIPLFHNNNWKYQCDQHSSHTESKTQQLLGGTLTLSQPKLGHLGSEWPKSSWDCSTALPCLEPSPRIILIIISPDLSTGSGPKRKSCKTSWKLIPSAAVFQQHAVCLYRKQLLSSVAVISLAELLARTKQSLAHFSSPVLCLSVALSMLLLHTGLGSRQSPGTPWPLLFSRLTAPGEIFSTFLWFTGKGVHTNQRAIFETSLPHTSYSLDFAAFILLPLVLVLFLWWENQPILQ